MHISPGAIHEALQYRFSGLLVGSYPYEGDVVNNAVVHSDVDGSCEGEEEEQENCYPPPVSTNQHPYPRTRKETNLPTLILERGEQRTKGYLGRNRSNIAR